MNVGAVNNNFNQTNFGAKINFENPKFKKTMVDICDYEYAKGILDRFEAFHPNESVLIKLVKEPNKYNSYLEATNMLTNKAMKYRLTPEDANKDFEDENCLSGCQAFYSFLEELLKNKNFWGLSSAADYKRTPSPSEHSIFNA